MLKFGYNSYEETKLNTSATREKIQNGLNKIPNKIKDFFYSDVYILAVALISYIAWVSGVMALGFILIVLIASFALVVVDDAQPMFPLLFFVPFCISDTKNIAQYYSLLPFLAILIAALIFHFIFYRPKKFTAGEGFYSQIAVSVALILGGCTSVLANRYLGALSYTLLLGVGVLFVYTVFRNYIKNSKIDSYDYMAKTLMYMGLVMVLQIFTYYARYRFGTDISTWNAYEWINLGWGIDNNAATLLLVAAPATFYLSTKSHRPFPFLLLGFVQYAAIILSFSRGSILVALVTAPFVVLLTLWKAENKWETFAVCAAAVMFVFVAILALYKQINAMTAQIFVDGISSNSRVALYLEALECFKNHPLFGVGGGYSGTNYENHVAEVVFYWFHSTPFEIIGGYGLLGIAAYGYNYYKRIKVTTKDMFKDSFTQFIILSVIGFELYSLVDTGTFVPIPNMFIIFALMALMEFVQQNDKSLNRFLSLSVHDSLGRMARIRADFRKAV